MDDARSRTRREILEVAAGLVEQGGVGALSTRSVATAAGIRAASLYSLFGDKDGLLDALAIHAFERYLAEKTTLTRTGDPVEDMRRGWDAHVDFGVRHPGLYLLMFGSDRPGRRPPAVAAAHDLLLGFLERAAAAGRLRVAPALAARMLLSAVVGVTLTRAGDPAAEFGPDVSARTRDALVDSLVTDPGPAPDAGLASRALALDAALRVPGGPDLPLRPTEVALLHDWLAALAR